MITFCIRCWSSLIRQIVHQQGAGIPEVTVGMPTEKRKGSTLNTKPKSIHPFFRQILQQTTQPENQECFDLTISPECQPEIDVENCTEKQDYLELDATSTNKCQETESVIEHGINAFALMKRNSLSSQSYALTTHVRPINDSKIYGIECSNEEITHCASSSKKEFLFDPFSPHLQSNTSVSNFQPILRNETLLWYDEFEFDSTTVNELTEWLKVHKKIQENELYDSDGEEIYQNSSHSIEISLLMTGPIGCGKSYLIKQVAQQLNFSIIEINPAMHRNSESILTYINESTKSQNVLNLLDTREEPDIIYSLILIEDIDCVFPMDQGFFTTLGSVLQTSKRPFIFTTNYPAHYFDNFVFKTNSICIHMQSPQLKGASSLRNLHRLIEQPTLDPRKLLLNFPQNSDSSPIYSDLLFTHFEQFIDLANFSLHYLTLFQHFNEGNFVDSPENYSIFPTKIHLTNQLNPLEELQENLYFVQHCKKLDIVNLELFVAQLSLEHSSVSRRNELVELERKIKYLTGTRKRKRVNYAEYSFEFIE